VGNEDEKVDSYMCLHPLGNQET